MIRQIVSIIIIVLCSNFVFAKAGFLHEQIVKKGFYVGAGIGQKHGIIRTNKTERFSATQGGITSLLTQDIRSWLLGTFGWDGAFFAGYDYLFTNHFYWAGEGFVDIGTSKGKFSRIRQVNSGLYQAEGIGVAIPYTIGGTIKSGLEIAPGSIFYSMLGYVNSQFEISNPQTSVPFNRLTGIDAQKLNFRKNKNGVLFGIGTTQQLSPQVSLREEYSISQYQSFNGQAFSSDSSQLGSLNRDRFITFKHPQLEQYTLSVIYHFDANSREIEKNITPTIFQFYIGGGFNRTTVYAKTYGFTDVFSTLESRRISRTEEFFDYKNAGFEGDIFVGLAYTFANNIYLATQLFGSVTDINHAANQSFLDFPIVPGNPSQQINFQAFWKMKNSYGSDIRLGYQLSPYIKLYALAGIARTSFELIERLATVPEDIANQAVNFSKKELLTGVRLGIGHEIGVTKHIGLRGEYIYTIYNGFTGGRKGPTDPNNNLFELASLNVKPTVTQFKIALAYHF